MMKEFELENREIESKSRYKINLLFQLTIFRYEASFYPTTCITPSVGPFRNSVIHTCCIISFALLKVFISIQRDLYKRVMLQV